MWTVQFRRRSQVILRRLLVPRRPQPVLGGFTMLAFLIGGAQTKEATATVQFAAAAERA